jgi:transposase-like protein
MGKGKIYYRYSESFKQKVVSEIEKGELSIFEAQKLYGINGGETIQNWISKLGKNHLLNRVVRIEMKDEKDRIKELEKEKNALEKAVAQLHLKVLSLESLLEEAEEVLEVEIKKSIGTKDYSGQKGSLNRKGKR